jgi:hypothetical protein
MSAELLKELPGLLSSPYNVTSAQTTRYNCIAWAAGDTRRWWWPDRLGVAYWPPQARREETLDAFAAAFGSFGYLPCDDADLVKGIEKIAIFANGPIPTHAARQLPDGTWTSKCGRLEDISHILDGVRGVCYGEPALFISRDLRPIWNIVNAAFQFRLPTGAAIPPYLRVRRALEYAQTGSKYVHDGFLNRDVLRRIGVSLPFQTLLRVGAVECDVKWELSP